MKNATSLKARIRNLSKEINIASQIILQNYMMEKLLERITLSPYHSNFVLKGGMLIGSLIGLESRSTMDLDATIQNYQLNEKNIEKAFSEIFSVKMTDGIKFSLTKIGDIRENDIYGGFRVYISATFETIRIPLKIPLKIDLSTGDKITPNPILYDFKLLLEERTIPVFSYNIETILAEKLETVLARSILNTRLRDFYDIYTLSKLTINYDLLLEALKNTSKWRGTEKNLLEINNSTKIIRVDNTMLERWKKYQAEFVYSKEIEFSDILDKIEYLLVIT